jgi:hypothetical protein
MELGGGTEILHEPDGLVVGADPREQPLVRAAELVTRFFCVGEALSIPLLRGTWNAAEHPLPKAVLGCIVKDEAAHGTFGFTFLDWARPGLDAEALSRLGRQADRAIDAVVSRWNDLRAQPKVTDRVAHPLGWMQTEEYLTLAERSLESSVRGPLLERGIPLVPRASDGTRLERGSS